MESFSPGASRECRLRAIRQEGTVTLMRYNETLDKFNSKGDRGEGWTGEILWCRMNGLDHFSQHDLQRQVKGKRKRKIRKESELSRVAIHQIKEPGRRIDSGPQPTSVQLDPWAGVLVGPLPSSVEGDIYSKNQMHSFYTFSFCSLPHPVGPSAVVHPKTQGFRPSGKSLAVSIQVKWTVWESHVYFLNMTMIKALAKKTSVGRWVICPRRTKKASREMVFFL